MCFEQRHWTERQPLMKFVLLWETYCGRRLRYEVFTTFALTSSALTVTAPSPFGYMLLTDITWLFISTVEGERSVSTFSSMLKRENTILISSCTRLVRWHHPIVTDIYAVITNTYPIINDNHAVIINFVFFVVTDNHMVTAILYNVVKMTRCQRTLRDSRSIPVAHQHGY